jgi:hypothetical protein
MKPKQRKCRERAPGCYGVYWPRSSFQKTCDNPKCAFKKVDRDKAKKEAKKRAESARETRERKEALKTRGDHLKEAQREFNKFIRMRDAGKPCISCGRFHDGQMHAGHFLTTAARPDLRFCEHNCFAQCAPCNNHLSGNIPLYRQSLITILGPDLVDHMETGPRGNSNWSIEEIKEIKQFYREEWKRIKANET